MTEKRFEYLGLCQFFDNVEECDLEVTDVVDLLNEQHETIEQLKDNCKILDEVKCEIAEENEQLKQQLADVDRLIDDLGHDEMRRQYEEIFKGDVE